MAQYMQRVTNKLLDMIELKVHDEKVDVELAAGDSMGIATTGVMVALTLPAIQAAREAARRNQSTNQLKQIALALHNYHDAHKTFPPRVSTDKDGKPLLSWRVAILPYLEEAALYKEFHLDEPWDSEHNKKLVARMPDIYRNASLPGTDSTVYLAVAGPGALFGEADAKDIRSVVDGTSNTIGIVEADPDRAVIWTRPDDLPYDADNPLAGLGKLRPAGFNAMFLDGHVRFISEGIDPELLKSLFTYAGREQVQLPH
jgi:prepilin-type processing-associated H-X9-DG protein